MNHPHRRDRRAIGSFVFGIGFGAFVDGIVLHQILQWHHMLSARPSTGTNTVDGLEANVLADGLFHVFALAALVAGTLILRTEWRHGRHALSWQAHIGLGLMGWATFNLVEGLVNHHLLDVHHVRDDVADASTWDVGFLVMSAVMLLVGSAMWATSKPHPSEFDDPDVRASGIRERTVLIEGRDGA